MSDYSHISFADIMQELEQLAAERPDCVYVNDIGVRAAGDLSVTCKYVHHDGPEATPGCIMGHALHRLGVSLEDLQENDVVHNKLRALGIHVTLEQGFTVRDIQSRQDSGMTWGEAVNA